MTKARKWDFKAESNVWKKLFLGRVRKFRNIASALETEWEVALQLSNQFLRMQLLKSHIAEIEVLKVQVKLQKDTLLQWIENMMPLVELEDSFLGELAELTTLLEVRMLKYHKYLEAEENK